jgi:hypothetical protein
MSEREVPWSKMFAYDLPTPKKIAKAKCTCGNDSCKNAKKIKCTCRCHSEFHGASNRIGMEPLDKALGLDGLTVTVTKEDPKPLPSRPRIGDLALDLELAGRLEWPYDEK